jgi:hypothetical protein
MRWIKRRPSPALVVALISLFVALTGVGVAATGSPFILGASNSADKPTALSSPVATDPTLVVANSGGRPAARFSVQNGVAPFLVSSSAQVVNLNASLFAGNRPSYYVSKGNVKVYLGSAVTINPGGRGTAKASCPNGSAALGGGHYVLGPPPIYEPIPTLNIVEDGPPYPFSQGEPSHEWWVTADNNTASAATLRASVICGPV